MLEVELDVDEEPLAVAPLLLEHAVEAVQDDAAELDRHRDAPPLDRRRGRQGLDVRRDVVGAEERRAAVERRDRRADGGGGRADPRRSGRRATRASVLLRERPTSTGRPIRQIRSSPRTSSRFWSGVLPKPIPGSRQTCSSGIPAATAAASRSSRNAGHLADDVVVPRLDLHRARLPLHVHQANVRAGVGDHARELRIAAQRRDVVHERGAELERPAGDLGLRRVDRDRQSARAPRAPARTRRSSSSSDTAAAPGRVDSPPTSTRRAPSASSRRAVATAAAGSRLSPPSEKLSGVTLTTPITEGRGQHSASGGRLTRRWSVPR